MLQGHLLYFSTPTEYLFLLLESSIYISNIYYHGSIVAAKPFQLAEQNIDDDGR
jgi:hypothetical protein